MTRPSVFYLFAILLSLLGVQNSIAQQNWSTTISGLNGEIIRDVFQKSDGNYIIAGQSASFSDPTNGDAYLAKLDSYGTIVWQKSFGEASKGEAFYSARPTSDGGYVAAGVSQGLYFDVYMVKVTSQGNTSWQKKYTLGTNNSAVVFSVREAQGGGYILAGWAEMPSNGGDGAGLILKFDTNGNLLWQNRFEIDGGNPDVYGGSFTNMEATSDGGAIAVGCAGGIPGGVSFKNVWVVKINSSGGMTWQRNYGGPVGCDFQYEQIKVINGGYALLGNGNGFWFLKLDNSGNIVPNGHRLYSYSDQLYTPSILAMDQSTDGNFFLTGYGYSVEQQQLAPIVVKLNSSGDLLWAKASPGNMQGTSLSRTSDNGFVIGAPFSNTCTNNQDMEIIKLDSAGTSCEFNQSGSIILQPPPAPTSQSLPTSVVSAGLSLVSTNPTASNATAIQSNQCSAGVRGQSECGLSFT
jgi:hypothetical protein